MKKFITITLIISVILGVFAYSAYAEPLTEEVNGINGEIIVKYGGEATPPALLGGQGYARSNADGSGEVTLFPNTGAYFGRNYFGCVSACLADERPS
jgi:hypothetical protein